MEKSELRKKAKKVLAHYPAQKAVYVTDDGQCFFDRHQADAHQQRLGKREDVLVVNRAVQEKLEEIKAKMTANAGTESGTKEADPNAEQSKAGGEAENNPEYPEAKGAAGELEAQAPKKATRTRSTKTNK